jgi:nicotinamidase-related amidase
MTSAPLVIDVRQALGSGPWAAFDTGRVLDRINPLIRAARAAGAPVVFVQHEEGEGPMQFEADGWQLDARLDTDTGTDPGDPRMRKTACDAFHRTGLQTLLQERGVAELEVCGMQSGFCIDSTVRGALSHGYPVVLAANAHTTLDNGVLTAAQIGAHHNAALANLGSDGTRAAVKPTASVHFAG